MRINFTSLFVLPLLIISLQSASFVQAAEKENTFISQDAKLETLWEEGAFTEGVAVAPDGLIYFSDIPSDQTLGRILRFDPATKKIDVACKDSGKSNGLMFDHSGTLIAACGAAYGKRSLAKLVDGKMETIVSKYDGKLFNSPNDLTILTNGNIYFSDPRYGGKETIDLDHQSVYLFNPGKSDIPPQRVTTDIRKPNGVIVSPDGKTLYVAETDNGRTNAPNDKTKHEPRMTLNAFAIQKDGTLGKKQVLVDFGKQAGIDGMTVDNAGNIYAAVRNPKRFGIAVYSPQGKELAFIPTPKLPTNCTFGIGKEANVLYMTAGKGLYRMTLTAKGYHTTDKN